MGNQKYIISSLLLIIVILLGFVTYLLLEKPTNQQKTLTQKTKISESKPSSPKKNTAPPKELKRAPSQPEVYLGYKVSIPKNKGCIDIGQYGDDKKPGQEEVKNNLTKEQLMIFEPYTLNGWMFQQACKADDYTFAYSLYNKDRSNKYLSNNLMAAFVEDKISLSYFKDERINKPKSGSEICTIYKLTSSFLEFSCNTDNGMKKWQLPFDQNKRVTPLN